MYLEARKIHLIEKVLKVENEHILIELETVFNRDIDISNKPGIDDFVGIFQKKKPLKCYRQQLKLAKIQIAMNGQKIFLDSNSIIEIFSGNKVIAEKIKSYAAIFIS